MRKHLTGVTTMTRKRRKKMNDLIVKSESGGMELSSSALDTLMKYEETLAALKTDYDELKKKLLQEMEKKNVIKVETGGIRINYIAETDREKFNSKAFRNEHPDLYDSYVDFVPVKASVRIALK